MSITLDSMTANFNYRSKNSMTNSLDVISKLKTHPIPANSKLVSQNVEAQLQKFLMKKSNTTN